MSFNLSTSDTESDTSASDRNDHKSSTVCSNDDFFLTQTEFIDAVYTAVSENHPNTPSIKTEKEVTLKKKESDATEDYCKEKYKSNPINSKKWDGYTQENDIIWLDYDDDEDFQMSQPVVVISSDEEEEESQSMLLEDRDDDDLRHFFNIQDLEFEEDLKLESEANQNRDHHMHKGDYSPRGDRVDKSQEKICSELYSMETQIDDDDFDTKTQYDKDSRTHGEDDIFDAQTQIDGEKVSENLENTVPYVIDESDEDDSYMYGALTQVDKSFSSEDNDLPDICDDDDDHSYDAETQYDRGHVDEADEEFYAMETQTDVQVNNQSDRLTEKPRPTTTAGEEQRRKEELTIYEANTQVDGTDVFGEESDTELFEAATQFDPVSHQKFKAEVMDSDFVTGLVEKVVDDLSIASTQVDNTTRPCQTDKSDHVTDREHSSKSLDKHNSLSGIKITGVHKERSYGRNSAAGNQCKQNGEHLSDIVVKNLSGGDLPSSDIVDGNACTYNRAEVFLDLEEDDEYDNFTQVDTDKHPVETDEDVEKDKFQEIVIIDDEEEEDVYNQPTQVDLHDKLGSSSDIEDVDMVKQSTSTDQDKSPQKTGLLSSAESNSEVTGKKNIPNRLKLTPMKRKPIVIDAKPQKTLKEKRDSFTIEKDSVYSTKQKPVKRTDSDATGGTSGTWLSKGPYAEAKLTKTIATRRRRPSKSKAPQDSANDLKKKTLEAKTKMEHRASEKIAEQVPHAKRQKTQRETRCGDVSDVQMPNEEEIRKKGLPLLESLPQKRRSEVIQEKQNISLTQSSTNTAMPSTPYTESDISSHKERDTSSCKERDTSLHKEMDTSSNKERNSSLHKEIDTSSLKDRDTSSYTKTDTSAKTKESLLIESKSMFSRKRDEDKDRRDSSHREKDSSHKESDSSHRKRDSSSRKERDSSSRREKDNSSHRERDSSSHKERDSSHKERDSLSRRERDSSSRRERDSSSRRERDSSSRRERDSSSHRERESSSQRERDSSSHRERESSSQRERDSSSHKERDSSSRKERDSSHKERDSSSRKERYSSHKERDSSSRRERDSSSHRERDSSSHRERESSSQRENSADLNQPIREPVRPQNVSLMEKPVPGVSIQVMGPGLPELPGLQTGMSNRMGKPLGDITAQGQLPVQSITLDHFLIKLLKWNPVWFNEQEKCKTAPPQIEEENPLFSLNEAYSSYSDYVKIFTPHLLFETWEMACHGWKQQKQQGCPHLPVCLSGVESSQEKKLMTFVCYHVTSKRKYNQGMCPNEGDLVVNHTYILAKAPPPQPGQPPKEGPQFYPTLGFVEKVQPYWRDDMNAKIMGALPLLKEERKEEKRSVLQRSNKDHSMVGTKIPLGSRLVHNLHVHITDEREADKIQPRQDLLILCMRIKTKHRPLKLLDDKPSTIQHVVSLVSLIRQFVAMTTLPQSHLMQHILKPGNHGVYGETHLMTKTDTQQLSSYNSSQQKAICTAAKVARQSHILPRVCLLQGPPGTGKSHTIVGIIDKIVKDTGRRARICLCAPSNAAVDELVRKFTAHKRQMTKKYGNYILRLVRIGNVKSLHGDVVRYSFNEVVKKTIETEIKLKNEKNIPESTRNELQSLTKKIDVLKKKLDDLRRKQEFVQVKRDELDLGKLERKKRDLETQCNKMFRDIKLTRAEEVMIKKNVLWKAHVICGTLNSFGSFTIQNLLSGKHENQWFNFDCVIVDEASQATELDCLIPLQYNTSKLIMVGDPEQLPPTVLSKMAADKCFGQSLFERLIRFFRYQDPVHLLDTQYRMDPQIATFPSQYIYQGKLKSDVSVEFRCKDFPLKPYIVFDLVAGQEITSTSGSVSNKAEANFTVALCSFILSRTKMPQSSIGIIAPYQSQKSILTTLLHQNKMPEVEVGTVDGFQGREKQVIVLSCVRARSATGGIGFLADRRRMNVSLTRARSALYVVGHLDSLEQAGGDWKMLIQDARNRGMVTRVSHQQNYHDAVKVCWKPRY